MKEIKSLLNLEVEDMLMVGIFGVGGIGKTTIAKAVFNLIADQFQGVCFLENVRENLEQSNGFVKLQERLLSNILVDSSLKVESFDQGIDFIRRRLSSKRVLLILDLVDKLTKL